MGTSSHLAGQREHGVAAAVLQLQHVAAQLVHLQPADVHHLPSSRCLREFMRPDCFHDRDESGSE